MDGFVWQSVFLALAGFLLGGVLFSYHLPRLLRRIDVTQISVDNNPGSANAFRYAGVPVGLLCLLLDMGKGFAPVFLATRRLPLNFPLLPLVMLAPVLGHALAPWYRFGGGKAIATAFGVLIGLLPLSQAVWVLVFWYLFFSLVWIIRPNERRSFVTFCVTAGCCVGGALVTGHLTVALGCVLVCAVPAYKNLLGIRQIELAQARASLAPDESDERLPQAR